MKTPTLQKDIPIYEGPETHLESMFIEEYLQTKGFSSIKELCNLTEAEAKKILIEACKFASLKLAEIESRVRLTNEIHYQEK
jgi:hypothetical protein